MHERRLEALARECIVERDHSGSFFIPADYREQVLAHEGRGGRESVELEVRDPHSLAHQIGYEGPTWLDRAAGGLEDLSQRQDRGFGREVAEAWKQRETTLKELGLGQSRDGAFYPSRDWLKQLGEMERRSILDRLERDTGRVAHFARDGDKAHGLFTSRIHAAERSYAVLEHGRTATLVPWRAEIDRAFNNFVSGQVNGRNFDFKFGREVEKSLKRGLGLEL